MRLCMFAYMYMPKSGNGQTQGYMFHFFHYYFSMLQSFIKTKIFTTKVWLINLPWVKLIIRKHQKCLSKQNLHKWKDMLIVSNM